MGEIISSTKVLDKRTVNYVSGGPYTLIIYNSKTKEIEHLFEDEDGLTEFAIEGTDRAIECSEKKESAQVFITANKLTFSSETEKLTGGGTK